MTTSLNPEAVLLSAAIALIHDAAVDPKKWAPALQRSCEFVGGIKANLFWQDNAAEQVMNLHLFNDDPYFTRLYMDIYAPLNPCIPAIFSQDVGLVYAVTDLVPVAELVETRFFKEWIAPQGLFDSIGVVLERDMRGAAFLAFEVSALADDGAKRRAALLVPHFQRAVAIGRFFVTHKANETALTETLDEVSDAVFLLAGDLRVVFANKPARHMIDEKRLLLTRSDTLHAVAVDADQALSSCVRALGENDADACAHGVTVTLLAESDTRWIANVLPLADGARHRTIDGSDIVAAMFVRKSTAAPLGPLEVLAKNYKLTASEIRVVEAMLRINGLDPIADALGISKATVKTHLNHVYQKCGVNNQRGLIKLVTGVGVT